MKWVASRLRPEGPSGGGWPSGEAGREGRSLGVLGAVQRPGGCRQGLRGAGPR